MLIAAVSGGADSVAMLWLLLSGSDEPIHVHHVSIRARTGRWRTEDAAMERIVPWLTARARPFAYTTSVRSGRGLATADIVIVTEDCGTVARERYAGRVRALARGANAHDMGDGGVGRRQAAAQRAWERALGPRPPPIIFPVGHLTRPRVFEAMPEELAAMTWSCRRPQPTIAGAFRPCGTCKTCHEIRAHGAVYDFDRAMPALEEPR